jgi:hypothetical protein
LVLVFGASFGKSNVSNPEHFLLTFVLTLDVFELERGQLVQHISPPQILAKDL